jgi:hypothetical protein
MRLLKNIIGEDKSDRTYFIVAFIGWFFLTLGIQLGFGGIESARVATLLVLLCGGNFVSLWGLSRALIEINANNGGSSQAIFWLTAKLLSICLIGITFYTFRFSSLSVLVMGLGTLIAVPLVGGCLIALKKV